MPQKKNADMLELARGKAGTLLGYLTGLLAVMKGLPSAYDKDLQEDKAPVFAAFDTLDVLLPVVAATVATLNVRREKMAAALDGGLQATELADYLVRAGVPFRQAHSIVGTVVRKGLELGVGIERLTLAELQAISPAFGPDVHEMFDAGKAVAARSVEGGTAPAAVAAQLQQAKACLSHLVHHDDEYHWKPVEQSEQTTV
jgi:argininosuccinate lyase